jgi:hypothetical protein
VSERDLSFCTSACQLCVCERDRQGGRRGAREIVCVCARTCVFKTLRCIMNRRRMQPCLGEGQVLQEGLKEQTRKWWAARGSICRRSNSNMEEGKRKSEEMELGEQSGKGQVQLGVRAKG